MLCITESDCEAVLACFGGGYAMVDYSMTDYTKERRGYLGQYYLLTINAQAKGKKADLKFFVKSVQGTGMDDSFADRCIFSKELLLYKLLSHVNKVYPQLDTRVVPKMYHYNLDKTLVLEDLRGENFVGYNSMIHDRPHMLASIEALAKLHTISIVYEDFKSKELGYRYEIVQDWPNFQDPTFDRNKDGSGHRYVRAGENAALKLVDLTNQREPEKVKKIISNFIEHVYDVLNDKNKYKNVVCQGDAWGFNLLFKYDKGNVPIEAKVVDFQLNRYAPPAHDLTYLLYMASDRKSYHQNVHDYYDYYYKCLAKELGKYSVDINNALPRSEFDETCKVYMPIAKFVWLLYRTTSQSSEEAFGELILNKALAKDVICGNKRGWYVEKNFNNDKFYREQICLIFQDFLNTIFLEHMCIDDCFKVIEKKIQSNEYEFIGCNMELLEEKVGFLGDHYNLQIKIKRGDKVEAHDFFVKMAPSVPMHMKFLTQSGALYKEQQFFKRIVEDIAANQIDLIREVVPSCYLSEPGVLILEDLKPKGYKIHDARRSMDLPTVHKSLRALAKLHASGILFEEKTGMYLGDIYKEELKEAFYTQGEMSRNWGNAGKKGLATQIKLSSNYTTTITPSQFLDIASNIIDQFPELVEPSKEYRNTICHGDFWGSNMMFANDCILVDFQSYRYATPANDLMQFLYLSTNRDFRSKHLDHAISFYYEEFRKCIESYDYKAESIFSFQDFLDCCEREKIFAIAQTVTHFHTILMSPERAKEVFDDPEFCGKTYFEDKSEHIIISTAKDPLYKERSEEAIRDLRELCENIHARKVKIEIIKSL